MKILITTGHLGVAGGAETHVRALLPLLRDAGHEIAVAYETTAGAEQSTILDHVPDVEAWQVAESTLAASIQSFEPWAPDVVYNHGLLSTSLESAIADRFPTLLFAHAYYGVCVSGTKRHIRPTAKTCERAFGLACLPLYLPKGCGGMNPRTTWKLYQSTKRRRAMLERYRTIVVASVHMHTQFVENGVSPERLKLAPLFPPGLNPCVDPPAPRTRSNRILFVGRIVADKGWRHMLVAVSAAARQLGHSLTLVVVGDGPDRTVMEKSARQAGMAVEFRGWLDRAGVNAEFRVADVLLMPSIWPEPFGLVGVEAACFGLPSVGYDSGGLKDWLIPGISGESAAGDRLNPHQLAAALVRALATDEYWQRLRVGAWETARTFTPQAHLVHLEDIFARARAAKTADGTVHGV